MAHQKHTKLTKPFSGEFARNEYTILGTPCDDINKLVDKLIASFSKNYKVVYCDADHKASSAEWDDASTYTDKINYQRLDWKEKLNAFQNKALLNNIDVAFVNGNHFKGKNQILVIDSRKKESISRKMDRLDNVILVLYKNEEEKLYDFLSNEIKDLASVPSFSFEAHDEIIAFLHNDMIANKAEMNSLILAGGKSERMGKNKADLKYHGKTQKDYLMSNAGKFSKKAYLSYSDEVQAEIADGIKDTFIGLGPFGAILSAFREFPDHAWLVIACDLPFVDKEAIKYLIARRNPSKIATAFLNPATGFADPLFTIWEPKSYLCLLQFLAQGYSCPRKVLINSDVELIDLPNKNWLKNANTPEEYEEVKKMLSTG